MKENLAKSVEIMTETLAKLKELFEQEIANGNSALAQDIVWRMCDVSRAITEAVKVDAEEPEKSLEMMMKMAEKISAEIAKLD